MTPTIIPLLVFATVRIAANSMCRKGQITSRTQGVLLAITALLCLAPLAIGLLHRSAPR